MSNNPIDTQEWRRKAAKLKKEIYVAKKNAFSEFIEKADYRKDAKKVYRYVNKITCQRETRKEPLKFNGKTFTSSSSIAEAFNKHYSSQHKLSPEAKKKQRQIKKDLKKFKKCQEQTNDIFRKEFTIRELDSAIHELKDKKSPGPDKIHAEFLKHLGQKGRNALLKLFNLSWTSTVPTEWKKAIIIPILKKRQYR